MSQLIYRRSKTLNPIHSLDSPVYHLNFFFVINAKYQVHDKKDIQIQDICRQKNKEVNNT